MQDLLRQLNREYSLGATELRPMRSIWKVISPKGCFVLKRMPGNADQILFQANCINLLKRSGFTKATPMAPTKDGLPYLYCNERFYTLSPWYNGINASFNQPKQVEKIAETFGALHQTSLTAINPSNFKSTNQLTHFLNGEAFLKATYNNLTQTKGLRHVDHTIKNWSQYYLFQASFSIKNLMQQDYNSWFSQTHNQGFCHNDPAPRNILLQKGDLCLIDWEHSCGNTFLQELATLISRVLQVNGWNHQLLELIATRYSQVRKIEPAEQQMLPFLFCFPQRFWRLCSQRFQEKPDWSERHFQQRIWEITHSETERLRFLKTNFRELQNLPDLPGGGR